MFIHVHLWLNFPVKAVILAAGKGTRMRELTNELPKPMLRVQGKPILEHIVAGILAAGVRDIFIVTGWRADVDRKPFWRRHEMERAHCVWPAGRPGRHGQGAGSWRRISSAIRRFC